jgi:dephospho-CoA kinase
MDAIVKSWHIGLTGGIGSGKSTVAALLAECGAHVIDADAISRATTAAGGAAIPAIAHEFGSAMITADGALDREQMRQTVFSDPIAKKKLENIIHPLVAQKIASSSQQAEQSGANCIVYDLPLLMESGHWRAKLDKILVVDCNEATQQARVLQRNGLSVDAIQKIMSTQASRTARLQAADCVIYNEGISLDELAKQAQEIGAQFGL